MSSRSTIQLEEHDTRFYVGQSTISGAGKGLFARKSLSIGDRLAVIGVLLRRESLSDYFTGFADEYKFRVGDLVLIPCGFAGMANHSLTLRTGSLASHIF